jgi:LAGLIDADG endonuclease
LRLRCCARAQLLLRKSKSDTEVLVKIQNNLGIGSITQITNKNDKALRLEQKSTIIISKQEGVNKLIANLDQYGPLNTTKYLDFLSWKKAFLLYISSKEKSIIVLIFTPGLLTLALPWPRPEQML